MEAAERHPRLHVIVRRIVSLVPSTTESVVAFGGWRALVACTRYCVEPRESLTAVRRIGGTKNPDREAIAALEPDLVLANAEENRPQDIDWLAERRPLFVQTPRTVAEAADCLVALAARLGVDDAAHPFVDRLRDAVDAPLESGPPLRVFAPIWRKPWMGVNGSTYVHDVLRRAGAENVCADLPARYPEVAPEWVREQRVDAVLLPSEPWAFDDEQRSELQEQGTFGSAVLALCDGRDLCWHGVHAAIGLPRVRSLVTGLRRAAGG
jgi:ABC-type Fe3+-hydroxamate transport system substrate-binding protein